MIEFLDEVIRLVEGGDDVAIATVVARRGSAPGALGAKMLVRGDGTSLGSIGGGCVEADVWQAARSAQQSGAPALLSFRLAADEAALGGLICGGIVDILVEPIRSDQLPLYRRWREALAAGSRVALATVLPPPDASGGGDEVGAPLGAPGLSPAAPDPAVAAATAPAAETAASELAASDTASPVPPGALLPSAPSAAAPTPVPGDKALWPAGAEPPAAESPGGLLATAAADQVNKILDSGACWGVQIIDCEIEGRPARVAVEIHAPRSTVYVFGAGHLSKEIVPLAKHVGFRVVVIDDRQFFVTREAFPDADELFVADFPTVLAGLPVDAESYLVIVTRGHEHDGVVLEQALRLGVLPAYVGMIGSRSKVAAIRKALEQAGIPKERLDAVHAPIGLAIGARSPEEIAVSIVAELISVRGRQAAG
jgi:xanthine dehydrogenase accessory factor